MSDDQSERELRNTGDEPKVIVIAIDASQRSTRVVSLAARLARSLPDAALHLVHVFRTSRLERGHAWSSGTDTEVLDDAKEHLAAYQRQAKAVCRNPVTSHFLVGDPTHEILKKLEELHADLLVIGTPDHHGFERLLLGSIAETLTRRAGCSVLVVRPSTS